MSNPTQTERPYQGLWIALEGPDFSGTSSQILRMHNRIYSIDKGHVVLTTREPTMRKHGREIREWQLDPSVDIASTGDQFLPKYGEDRIDHTLNVIMKMLAEDVIVLSDRIIYSTLVYQGIQGKTPAEVYAAHRGVAHFAPDLTLVFDVDLDTIKERMEGAGLGHQENWDTLEFQRQAIEGYNRLDDMVKESPAKDNIVHIDARPNIDAVTMTCWKHIEPLLPMPYKALREKYGK